METELLPCFQQNTNTARQTKLVHRLTSFLFRIKFSVKLHLLLGLLVGPVRSCLLSLSGTNVLLTTMLSNIPILWQHSSVYGLHKTYIRFYILI
jgi:hypothetical protein